MDNNKKFWNRFAFIYEKVQTKGKGAKYCKQLYATDFSEKMVSEAKKKELPENVVIEQADATCLRYGDESFDAVVIANALHIMPYPEMAIREIRNALGFITFFPWSNEAYRIFIEKQELKIIYSKIIRESDFPESFVVCKKSNN